jgi:hypothetical protein
MLYYHLFFILLIIKINNDATNAKKADGKNKKKNRFNIPPIILKKVFKKYCTTDNIKNINEQEKTQNKISFFKSDFFLRKKKRYKIYSRKN